MAMYEGTTVTGMSREGSIQQRKAKAFDEMQQQQRDRQVYDAGAGDAYTSVERELMRRSMETPERGLAASVQNGMRENAYTNALIRAQREGNLSEEYINSLVEEELGKIGGL